MYGDGDVALGKAVKEHDRGLEMRGNGNTHGHHGRRTPVGEKDVRLG